jgi:hypothetical protein
LTFAAPGKADSLTWVTVFCVLQFSFAGFILVFEINFSAWYICSNMTNATQFTHPFHMANNYVTILNRVGLWFT